MWSFSKRMVESLTQLYRTAYQQTDLEGEIVMDIGSERLVHMTLSNLRE